MAIVRIDARGRVVLPVAERRRLGIRGSGELEVTPTPEGLLLEPSSDAVVRIAEDGLPVLEFRDGRSLSVSATLAAIRAVRDDPRGHGAASAAPEHPPSSVPPPTVPGGR